ncbi:LPXTG cell wall anchor domain-containing protein, partial [Lactococcus garvieae]|uniref:LPXTG cell wall anchor domain-containing protein n=1 Tax=Lactococcus garvieae TaxID=1363 RepID=UPI0005B4D227
MSESNSDSFSTLHFNSEIPSNTQVCSSKNLPQTGIRSNLDVTGLGIGLLCSAALLAARRNKNKTIIK